MRQQLSIKQRHELTTLMLADYTTRRETPKVYASYASEALGFPVNHSHVLSILTAFNIPRVHTPATPEAAVIEALEKRVEALERRLDVYMGVTK